MASVSNFNGGLEAHHGGAETKITKDVPGEDRPSVPMHVRQGSRPNRSAPLQPLRRRGYGGTFPFISTHHQEFECPLILSKDYSPSRDDFAAMLADSLAKDDLFEGSVVKGKVVGIEKDLAVIDVGLKMEGRVPVKEFGLGRPAEQHQGRRRRRSLPRAHRERAR